MEFIDLKAQYKRIKKEIDCNIQKVLDEGHYIMGQEVKELEKELAEYVGVKHCITCANGTDALSIAVMALGIGKGDAVFVPSFTFYSTAEIVSLASATPIFVDVNERTFNLDVDKLEKAIIEVREKTDLIPKAIIPVDLFGQPAEYYKIRKIAKKYDLYVIEDGAQGFGGEINGKKACSFGDISTTSFFPAKPLGCYGDGGAIFTDDNNLFELISSIRVHGKGSFKYDNVRVGMNSRLDTLQASVLLPKLKIFKEDELRNRNIVAQKYTNILQEYFQTPLVLPEFLSSWAQYTLILDSKEERKIIMNKLKEKNIPTNIYYPKPLHLQTVYKAYNFNLEDLKTSAKLSDRVLSIPMHPYLTEDEINNVCLSLISSIKEYRNGK